MSKKFPDKLRKLIDRSYARALNLFLQDTNRDYSKTVLVAGSGRSGTTWLAELININNDFRLIFEPFNDVRIESIRLYRRRQFLDHEQANDEFFPLAQQILSGQFRHPWADMFNRRARVDRRIVKVIRVSLFLKWLKVRFPELKIVFVIRHPFAVAKSKQDLGFGSNLEDIFDQPELLAKHPVHYSRDELEKESFFLQHVFLWCVENFAVLSELDGGDLYPVFYEELSNSPKETMEGIWRYAGVEPPTGDSLNFDRQSKSAKTGFGSTSNKSDSLSKNETQKALQMIRNFGLGHLYDESPSNLVRSEQMFLE